MTLPTHDAQPSRSIPRRPQMVSPNHSIPPPPPKPVSAFPSMPPPARPTIDQSEAQHQGHALDFATYSWDLATGGLKTLTAKREFPRRPDRKQADPGRTTERSYFLILLILSCILLMLIGGGVVLLVMLQL